MKGDAAVRARLVIAEAASSTDAAIALLRLFEDDFECGILGHAADVLAGVARKPGRKPSADDNVLLRLIAERRPIHGAGTVAAIVRQAFPGDARSQVNAAHRLRRKLRQRKTDEM